MNNPIGTDQVVRTYATENLMQERYCDAVNGETILAADIVMKEVEQIDLHEYSLSNKPILFIP